jgi:hypothetical protein
MAASSVTNLDGSAFQPQPVPRLTPAALRRARTMLGLSQVDLGHIVRLSCTAISQFENSRTVLRPKNEGRIVDCLAVRGIDVEGGSIRLRVPCRAAAE